MELEEIYTELNNMEDEDLESVIGYIQTIQQAREADKEGGR